MSACSMVTVIKLHNCCFCQCQYSNQSTPQLLIPCALCAQCALNKAGLVRQCYSVSFSCYVLQALVALLHLPHMCQLCSVHCHCWDILPSSCWPAKTAESLGVLSGNACAQHEAVMQSECQCRNIQNGRSPQGRKCHSCNVLCV